MINLISLYFSITETWTRKNLPKLEATERTKRKGNKFNLITAFDILDGNQLLGLLILHQPRHAEVPGPDIANQIVTVAVVHDRHVHAWSNRHRRPIHQENPNRNRRKKKPTTTAATVTEFVLERRFELVRRWPGNTASFSGWVGVSGDRGKRRKEKRREDFFSVCVWENRNGVCLVRERER